MMTRDNKNIAAGRAALMTLLVGQARAAAGLTLSDTRAAASSQAETRRSTARVSFDGGPPLVCRIAVDCGGRAVPNEPKIPCGLVVRAGDGTIEYDGAVGIEKRGNSSLAFPKPQYALELRASREGVPRAWRD